MNRLLALGILVFSTTSTASVIVVSQDRSINLNGAIQATEASGPINITAPCSPDLSAGNISNVSIDGFSAMLWGGVCSAQTQNPIFAESKYRVSFILTESQIFDLHVNIGREGPGSSSLSIEMNGVDVISYSDPFNIHTSFQLEAGHYELTSNAFGNVVFPDDRPPFSGSAYVEFSITPVPEPKLLVAVGLFILLGRNRLITASNASL